MTVLVSGQTQAKPDAAIDPLDPRTILLESRTTAQTIQDTNWRTSVLRKILQAQTARHDPHAALETLAVCQECSHKDSLLAPIAGELAEAGHIERALDLVEIIRSYRTI